MGGMSEDDIHKSHEKFNELGDEETQGKVMVALGNLVEAQKGMDMENMTEEDKKNFEKDMKEMWKAETGDDDESLFQHLFEHEKDGEGHDDEEGSEGKKKGKKA